MARTKFVCGNWKMHKSVKESVALVKELAAGLGDAAGKVQVAVAPPFTAIYPVAQALAGSAIEVSGQDVFWEVQGAFTGEVAAPMLAEAGAKHGIVGHSERRQFFGETDETVNQKLKVALAAGLLLFTPARLRRGVELVLEATGFSRWLDGGTPEVIHAVTEGPLGLAALASFIDTIERWVAERLRGPDPNANLPRLARLAEVWEKIVRAARDTESYNLERKPLVFSVFGMLAEAMR